VGSVVVASFVTDGPLISGSIDNWILNPAVQQAEMDAPEGSLMQLTLPNIGIGAQFYASQINAKWQAGQIVDPSTGERPPLWPGATTLATGDDSTGTLVLRWVKGQVYIFILIGIIIALAVALYFALRSSPYQVTRTIPTPTTSGASVWAWLLGHWGWVALGAGIVVVTPAVLKRAVWTKEDVEELEA